MSWKVGPRERWGCPEAGGGVCGGGRGGLLTFHSPSSGWVSCTRELPGELRVWEGRT